MDNKKIEYNDDYIEISKRHTPKSPVLKNSFFAFLSGGALCFIGQWLSFLFTYLGLSKERSYITVTVIYIVLASLATALGFFDKAARFCGAGTLVPVTGFSNSVTSSALDARSEGYVLGVGKGIFTVAGPVILFSTVAGTLYGIIYFIFGDISLL